LQQQRTDGGEPSAPATPGLFLLSYTTPRDAAVAFMVGYRSGDSCHCQKI
jgi:hypothetical protein